MAQVLIKLKCINLFKTAFEYGQQSSHFSDDITSSVAERWLYSQAKFKYGVLFYSELNQVTFYC